MPLRELDLRPEHWGGLSNLESNPMIFVFDELLRRAAGPIVRMVLAACALTGVAACDGSEDAAPTESAASPAIAAAGEATQLPAQASEPLADNVDATHTAQRAWPWRGAAEMATWRIKGAP
ncbi:hypothetical protein [Mitsuaria sp. 7]|uniref:hypothetical protein n=1 Tax=Mitsuaria sp. 7 TaxID=1658665 RepID=UPI0012FCA3D6|nr:hypothetical protein [Mitsuaria sp. 7]